MNQYTELLPGSQLKDKAKGALEGNYRLVIPALFLVILTTTVAQFLLQFISSFLLSFVLIIKTLVTTGITPEQLISRLEANSLLEAYSSLFICVEYVGMVIASLLTVVLNLGMSLICLNIACGRSVRMSDIFYGYRNNPKRAFGVGIVFVLISQFYSIPLNIFAYFVQYKGTKEQLLYSAIALCVGFAIYLYLSLGISQSFMLLLDFPDLDALAIIKLSNRIMKGNKSKLFMLQLSFLPLILLSILSFRIGDLWLTPYKSVTYAFFFINLMKAREATPSPQTY